MNREDTRKCVLFVFGTRPEAIKMATVVLRFKQDPAFFNVLVCVTGQHRQMMDQVLDLFEIQPDFDLNIMEKGQDLYDITAKVLLGMRQVLIESKPDFVLVHGDTSTSTAAALAAFYQHIPVCHIEAGLRTHNIYSPWPEEINRQITSRVATFHFAPTELSKQNLLAEGVESKKVYVTGNTVIDALFWVLNKIESKPIIKDDIISHLTIAGLKEEKLKLWESSNDSSDGPNKLILITGHRRENFGQGFIDICEAIKSLALKFPNVDFVYPMHLNPNVRKAIDEVFGDHARRSEEGGKVINNINFIEPLDYLPFVYLMNLSYLLLTDSGGIQEEAPSLGKPVLVMRDTTERPEALSAGTVKLVGTDKLRIISEVSELLENKDSYQAMSRSNNPYGDGASSEKIEKILLAKL
jgi:UDP-N-acetylglucosamine 2-epimerase (non-hydrolysing)